MDIHRKVVEFIDSGVSFAAAVVLRADGSTPQKAGARALIDAAGRIFGTVGGGLVEAEARRRAIEACRSKRPDVFDFNLDDAHATDGGPICGGSMRILIDPTAAKDRACHAQATDALRQRRRGVLLTSVHSAPPPEVTTMRWFAEDEIPADAGFPGADAVRCCLAGETPRLFVRDSASSEGGSEVLVEPVVPKPRLLIVGGGHVGQALARQAVPVGFDVTVLDDRPEFADRDLFPEGVTVRRGDVPTEIAEFPVAEDTYVVLVTRGHKHDAAALAACIHAPAAYVGMIGSRRKVALVRESFIQSGLADEAQFDRVFAPIGLDIGAVTVPEIAASITAQLIAVRRKGDARPAATDVVRP